MKVASPQGWSEPQIFDLEDPRDQEQLDSLSSSGQIREVLDSFDNFSYELYQIKFPDQIDAIDEHKLADFKNGLGKSDLYGRWVYFPWSRALVHYPTEDDHRLLRTSRNRNLVTSDEQGKLLAAKIAVLGLSVGSNIVQNLVTQGIGGTFILADLDELNPTNLNRIPATYPSVGIHKVDLMAQRISELDPYIKQIHYREGVTEENLEKIITNDEPDILIDEMDQLKLKLLLRLKAKEHRLPVLMATDDGDGILLDIERFDLEPDTPLLHGKLPQQIIDQILTGPKLSRKEAGMLIGQYFVGPENVPPRMIESLKEIGQTLPTWPQLGGAAALAGVMTAFATKKILLGETLNSGRFLITPDRILSSG